MSKNELSLIFMFICLVQLLTGFSFLMCMILDPFWEARIRSYSKKLNIYIHELIHPYTNPNGCLIHKLNIDITRAYIEKCFINKNDKNAIKDRKKSVEGLHYILKRIIYIKRERLTKTIVTVLFLIDTVAFWLFLYKNNIANISTFFTSTVFSKIIVPIVAAVISTGIKPLFTNRNSYTHSFFRSIYSQIVLLEESLFVLENKSKKVDYLKHKDENIKKVQRLTANIKEAENFLLEALRSPK